MLLVVAYPIHSCNVSSRSTSRTQTQESPWRHHLSVHRSSHMSKSLSRESQPGYCTTSPMGEEWEHVKILKVGDEFLVNLYLGGSESESVVAVISVPLWNLPVRLHCGKPNAGQLETTLAKRNCSLALRELEHLKFHRALDNRHYKR